MRETWLIHLCTDWMGDDGLAVEARLRVPPVQLRGRHPVAVGDGDEPLPGRRRPPGGRRRAVARRTSAASSPRRGTPPSCCRAGEHGPVRLPDPPGGATDLQDALRAISEQVRRQMSDPPRSRVPTRSIEGLRVEQDGPVLELEIDRPAKRNALDGPDRAGDDRRARRRRDPTNRCGSCCSEARVTTSAPASTSSGATPGDARPRVGQHPAAPADRGAPAD